jgi:hypothetical protein
VKLVVPFPAPLTSVGATPIATPLDGFVEFTVRLIGVLTVTVPPHPEISAQSARQTAEIGAHRESFIYLSIAEMRRFRAGIQGKGKKCGEI